MSGYIPVAKFDDLNEAKAQCFQVGGQQIILCRKGDEVYALEGRCSHAFHSLDGARVRAGSVMCPQHGARFNIETGAHLAAPAVEGIKTYAVRKVGEMVEVNVEEETKV